MSDYIAPEPEKCGRCGVLGNDRRTLWMACFYAMSELGIPFKEVGLHGVIVEQVGHNPNYGSPEYAAPPYEWERGAHTHGLFTLRVCKGCRGAWMRAIKEWFRAPLEHHDQYNSDGYVAPDTFANLLARVEALRTEAVALEQRVAASLRELRAEHDRREAEDSTKALDPDGKR